MTIFKRVFLFFLSVSLILSLCSWVNPDTVDVYSGVIRYVDTQAFPVSDLSGVCQYILESYENLALSSSGSIYNVNSSIVQGRILINGQEYQCRLAGFGGLSIYQSYIYSSGQSSSTRWAWVSYELVPDQGLPGDVDLVPFLTLAICFFIVLIFVVKVVLK